LGREAVGLIEWRGAIAEGKVLLEATEIILRGEIRARIPRDSLAVLGIEEGRLAMTSNGESLVLTFGKKEAEAWTRALAKAPPTLAQKLGIGPDKPAFLCGNLSDVAVFDQIAAALVDRPDAAQCLIMQLAEAGDLTTALDLARDSPDKPIWCVYAKGKLARPGDAEIRTAFRQAGFIDTKSCSLSERLTATRYGKKRESPARP